MGKPKGPSLFAASATMVPARAGAHAERKQRRSACCASKAERVAEAEDWIAQVRKRLRTAEK